MTKENLLKNQKQNLNNDADSITDNRQSDLTKGHVGKKLLKFSIPFLLSNILQALYNVADMLIVGKFVGEKGITAVNISGQVMMVISALIIGLSIGGTVLVSQFKGASDLKSAKKTIGTLLTLFAIIGVIMTVLSLVATPFILKLIKVPDEAFNDAVSYLRVCSFGIIFIFGYNAVTSCMRGLGDSKRPFYFIAFSTITNIVLDLILVGVFDMGATGAAIATVFSQSIAFLLSVIYSKRTGFIFDFKLKSFRINKVFAKLIFKIGLPSSVQMILSSTSFLFMSAQVNEYGLSASAAAGIGGKIDSFAVLPALAFSAAVSSMVGQNIGAKQFDRAKTTLKTGILYSMIISIVIFALVNIFAGTLISAFMMDSDLSSSKETIAIGIDYIRWATISYLLFSFMFLFNGFANGTGNTVFSLLNTIVVVFVLRIPLSILFSTTFGMGLNGIFFALGIAPLGGTLAGLIFYLSGRWKKSNLTSEITEAV